MMMMMMMKTKERQREEFTHDPMLLQMYVMRYKAAVELVRANDQLRIMTDAGRVTYEDYLMLRDATRAYDAITRAVRMREARDLRERNAP